MARPGESASNLLACQKSYKVWRKSLAFLLIFLTGIAYFFHRTQLLIAQDQSLVGIVYLCLKDILPERNDVVWIRDHFTTYGLTSSFLKKVVGLPGDVITFKDKALYIGQNYVARLSPVTRQGCPLTPLTKKEMRIPRGYVFVTGTHLRSFDSRYKEFGLVPVTSLVGKAIKLW